MTVEDAGKDRQEHSQQCSELLGFPTPFVVYMGGLFACIPASLIAAAVGAWSVAYWIGMLGPFLWIGVTMLYTVFVDSKKRWPWVGSWTRFVYIVTFGTPPGPPDPGDWWPCLNGCMSNTEHRFAHRSVSS